MSKDIKSVFFVALLFTFSNLYPALGILRSDSYVGITTTSGRWASQLGLSTGAVSSNPHLLVWSGSSQKQYFLFAFENTGTFDLSAGHILYSSAKPNGDASNPPSISFDICSGAWDSTSFTCSGSVFNLGSGQAGTLNFLYNVPTGNRLVIRATNTRSSNGNYVTTLNTQTFRSDIRSGQRFNS